MEQFSDKLNLKELMQTEGRFVGTTSGVSMLPMIKSGRDVVVIEKKTERLKPWDVALYTRGDSYVLHRVISVTDFGYLTWVVNKSRFSEEVKNAAAKVLADQQAAMYDEPA